MSKCVVKNFFCYYRGRNFSPGRRGISDVTSDPKTVNARIFVGSINVSMTREMLQEYFSQYGRVVGKSFLVCVFIPILPLYMQGRRPTLKMENLGCSVSSRIELEVKVEVGNV